MDDLVIELSGILCAVLELYRFPYREIGCRSLRSKYGNGLQKRLLREEHI